jgi:hypothetical protein
MLFAPGITLIRCQLARLSFNPVQLADQGQTPMGFTAFSVSTLRFNRIVKPASCMRHATHMGQTIDSC